MLTFREPFCHAVALASSGDHRLAAGCWPLMLHLESWPTQQEKAKWYTCDIHIHTSTSQNKNYILTQPSICTSMSADVHINKLHTSPNHIAQADQDVWHWRIIWSSSSPDVCRVTSTLPMGPPSMDIRIIFHYAWAGPHWLAQTPWSWSCHSHEKIKLSIYFIIFYCPNSIHNLSYFSLFVL